MNRISVRAEHRLIPWRAAIIPGLVVSSHTVMEIVYGHILGPNTLAEVKRIQLQKDFRNLNLMWGLIVIIIQFCAAVGLLTYLNCFSPLVVQDFSDPWSWWNAYLPAYIEFWVLTVFKDSTAMHFIHRWIHNKKYSYFYKIHELHHTYKANLNLINAALVDPADLLFENTIEPFLLVGFKALLSLPSQISIVAFLISIYAEGMNHSLNPYSVIYFFPPIDAVMKGNIAHNLHHVQPHSNFYEHPWHHLARGYQQDLDTYNKVMKTNVQFGWN